MRLLKLLFLLPIFANAQEAEVVLSLPEYKILYNFYAYNVAFGSIEGNLEYDIVVEGGTLEDNRVLTIDSSEVKLIFLKKNTNDTINIVSYLAYPLPEPNIYLGGKSDGESVNKAVTSIQVKYGPEITLVGVNFPVSGWTLISNGREVSGAGSELNTAACELMKESSGKYVTLVVSYKKPDKTITKNSSTFKVN
jgi:hypothetical protein